MINFKNVNGYIDSSTIVNNRAIEFNIDTVYIRSNIIRLEDNPELLTYDEIQMTYEEYEKYKESLLLSDVEVLKEQVVSLDGQVNLTINTETCTLEELKIHQIKLSEKKLEDYFKMFPIQSTCHKGMPQYYSVTKDKQALLAGRILAATIKQSMSQDIIYTSWNATGEQCTYDWTLAELQQLASEIDTYVTPIVSQQQSMDTRIRACETKEEVLDIDITFEEEEEDDE